MHCTEGSAQTADATECEQPSALELFMGADLSMRDMTFDHLYDVRVQLTPGMRWNIGKGWTADAQVRFTVANYGYSNREWMPRIGIAAIAKEFNWKKVDMKATVGAFSNNRYGLDVKAKYDPTDWFALEAQVGCTGMYSMIDGWRASTPKRFTAVGGVDFYLRKWQTQVRMRGGRFINEDIGAICDVMRHFNHCSVGLYFQSNKYTKTNGGFTIVAMIPPYQYKTHKKVRVRPASNFRLQYNMRGDGNGCKLYETTPEENERNGWFVHNSQQWERRNSK